ncbi:hypothetical protein DMENIID0001_111620 [Sergentomyia squamirostris]
MLKKILKILLISIGAIFLSFFLLMIFVALQMALERTSENVVENEYGVKFDPMGRMQGWDMNKIAERLGHDVLNKYASMCDSRLPTFNLTLCHEVLDDEVENILQMPQLKLEL